MINDKIKEILEDIKGIYYFKPLLDYITNLQKENERLNREVAKLHIIQEEYGNHIENTHIIDDYQKTYFMANKYLIELKNGKFVYVDELNDKYEDYKSRCEKANAYIDYYWISYEDSKKDENYEDELEVLVREIYDLYCILNGRSDE